MEIKKRLRVNGSNEVNAVLVNDEGEEYPVFLESLHNTVMFPLILESGYKLTSLPYGFVKNGVSFNQLPVEDYTCDDIMYERMYNSIGAKLDYNEIKSHIEVAEAVGRPIPPTNYTIHTREDFLKYLDVVALTKSEDDFMPLNYFVAPEARFNEKEYLSTDFLKYVQIISDRRSMSVRKFRKLIDWLKQFGLPANYNVQDVLDAYFAWGFDGLNFTVLNLRRESRSTILHPNRTVNAIATRRTQGLIDKMGNLLTPLNERDVVWKLQNSDPSYVADLTRDLPGMNDTRVVEYTCASKQDVSILEGAQFNISYSNDTIIMLQRTYPPIRIESPAETGSYIETRLALPANENDLYEICLISGLARMLYFMRKSKVRYSSYDALTISGCNPKTALDYVLTQFDLSKDSRTLTDEDVPRIYDADLCAFLDGTLNNEDAKSFLQDVIDGVFNIDNIARAKEIEAMTSLQSVFNEIYAVHNSMGIPLKEIYDKFRAITPNDKTIIFENNSVRHMIDVSPIEVSCNGYKRDLLDYDMWKARDCSFFTYVTMVAREVGREGCRRHVGVEFFMVDRNKKAVKQVLDNLLKMYEEKVYSTITNVEQQIKCMNRNYMFALMRFFEIALKGTITWPNYLGGGVQPASPADITAARTNLQRKIESTTTLCLFSTNSLSAAQLSFNGYCVNAYITPEYVIPRGSSPIHEVAFNAAWYDWEHENPEVYAQLVGLNVLPAGFKSWSYRYPDEQFVSRDPMDLENINSLDYYYSNSLQELNDFPVDMEFVSVTHPVDYMYPGFRNHDDDMHPIEGKRDGAPVVRLGITREITKNDYADILLPVAEEEEDQYIRQFHGFDAEALILVPDAYLKTPEDTPASLVVSPASGTVYLTDTQQVINFRRIVELDPNRYPVKNIYGRNYLIKEVNGRLWEARI